MFDICKIFTNEKFADTDVEKAFNIKCVRLLNRNLSAAPAKPLQIEDVSHQIEKLKMSLFKLNDLGKTSLISSLYKFFCSQAGCAGLLASVLECYLDLLVNREAEMLSKLSWTRLCEDLCQSLGPLFQIFLPQESGRQSD